MSSRFPALLLVVGLLAGCETAPQPVKLQPVESSTHLPLNGPAHFDQPPSVIAQQRPVYPRELRAAGVQGEARVELIVGVDGTVTDAIAIKATDVRFANAAIACVRGWKFRPATLDGKPVPTRLQVPIEFTLDSEPGAPANP